MRCTSCLTTWIVPWRIWNFRGFCGVCRVSVAPGKGISSELRRGHGPMAVAALSLVHFLGQGPQFRALRRRAFKNHGFSAQDLLRPFVPLVEMPFFVCCFGPVLGILGYHVSSLPDTKAPLEIDLSASSNAPMTKLISLTTFMKFNEVTLK